MLGDGEARKGQQEQVGNEAALGPDCEAPVRIRGLSLEKLCGPMNLFIRF